MQLSIFPLRLNLLPDGVLPLRVFEPRYLRMIAEASKRGMGLCLLGKAQDGGFSPLLAIGTRVEIAHSWRIAGVPTLGEGIAGVDPLSDFQAGAIAPDATVALAHTDIGVVRTWQPLMTVRSGDVVMPTVAGDYAYVAEAPFFAQVADNTVQTGSEEPLFNIEAWPAYENNVIWRPIRAGLA